MTCPPLPPAERQHGDTTTLPPLHVIRVISNPERFNSRVQLFKEDEHRGHSAGAIFYSVELAFGNRPFTATDKNNPRHFQYRSDQQIWHKENLINLGVSRLPEDAQYIAWVDADVSFTNPHWANETVQQLQHFQVVQMFNWAVDLGPDYAPMKNQLHRGFVYGWRNEPGKCPIAGPGGDAYGGGATGSKYHPGYAWAMRRKTFDLLGGCIDYAILGCGDYHMAQCLVNNAAHSFWSGMTQGYKDRVWAYQERCNRVVQGNVGYVDTGINHYFHGKKTDRGYEWRNNVLKAHKYDPTTDLIKDSRGVIGLAGNKPKLGDDIRSYFRTRNEDSIDL